MIWYPIPIGLGLAFIAFQQYLHLRKKDKDISKDDKTEANIIVAGPWQVNKIKEKTTISDFYFYFLFLYIYIFLFGKRH